MGVLSVFPMARVAQVDLPQGSVLKPLYARAGIPQYIIVNLRDSRVEIYSEPDPHEGVYKTTRTASKNQPLALNLGGGQTLAIDAAEVLP